MKKLIMIIVAAVVAYSCTSVKPINNNTMNLINNHTEGKDVSTKVVFNTQENKVVSLQILKGKQLKEHVTKVPAYLVCVTGEAVYADEKGQKHNLLPGNFVNIETNVKHWVDAVKTSNFLLIK
jgi:quercetin dioxygenase-like cupin family protein